MQLSTDATVAYVRHAFGQMLALVDLLGDDLLNVRPVGEGTNTVGALVVHCCGVTEFCLGHVGLGRPTSRDRESELSTVTTAAACSELIESALEQAADDLAGLEGGSGVDSPLREGLLGRDGSDAALALHVIEELFQHLGHMELTKDVLCQAPPERRAGV